MKEVYTLSRKRVQDENCAIAYFNEQAQIARFLRAIEKLPESERVKVAQALNQLASCPRRQGPPPDG